MEPPVRIELTTFRLQGGCSTTELGRRTELKTSTELCHVPNPSETTYRRVGSAHAPWSIRCGIKYGPPAGG